MSVTCLHRHHRPAFTLIELLVVIAIVGILVSLLGPAVQRARESARRLECENHIRQLALGVSMFHDSFGVIPSNGGADPKSTLALVGGAEIQPTTYENFTAITFTWGVGNPQWVGKKQTGSWCYSILPKIEQGAAYQNGNCGVSLPLFACPSRPRGPAMATADDQYARYQSDGIAMTKTDYAGNGATFPDRPDVISFRAIKDGLSQTLLIGEKAFDPVVQLDTSWYWDEPIWLGGSKGTMRTGTKILTDRVGIEFRENWGSPHDGGALFAFADGHVQFITTSADWRRMAAALSIDGGESEGLAE
ncbi:hypothetical protein CA13_11570 [Planctomycetes bacterium CA13]|uniref:DUF1559 domain-containing protein n=1 Tax=Novipirellula herctigrandis TaxID=2527986 RepID=A0A5C5YXX4_9BACT|nr:hypothetical protein CA13_11570 [Planctomycetes bacterium CA13]